MNIEIRNLTKKMLHLLALKAIAAMPSLSVAEIYEGLKYNGINGVAYESLYKAIMELVHEGMVSGNDGLYKIKEEGAEQISIYIAELENLLDVLNDFKPIPLAGRYGMPPDMLDMYRKCKIVKIVPYNPINFNTKTEREFFLDELPNRKNNVFSFDGRGLGKGARPNTIIAFQRNNMIRYIAIMERYYDDKGIKEMILAPGSIHELASPISSKDMQAIRPGFRFAQNKQTIEISEEVANFKSSVKSKW